MSTSISSCKIPDIIKNAPPDTSSSNPVYFSNFAQRCMFPYKDVATKESYERTIDAVPSIGENMADTKYPVFMSDTVLGEACRSFVQKQMSSSGAELKSCFAEFCTSFVNSEGEAAYVKEFAPACSCVARSEMQKYIYKGAYADSNFSDSSLDASSDDSDDSKNSGNGSASSTGFSYAQLMGWATGSGIASKLGGDVGCIWQPCIPSIYDSVFADPDLVNTCKINNLVICNVSGNNITANDINAKNFSSVTLNCGSETTSTSSTTINEKISKFFSKHKTWIIIGFVVFFIIIICVVLYIVHMQNEMNSIKSRIHS